MKDEIKVGDEVIGNDYRGVVVRASAFGGELILKILTPNGGFARSYSGQVIKTGRHFNQIEEVLEQLSAE